MTHSFPRLLTHGSSIDADLAVPAFPDAQQGSFSFFACGTLPMQSLSLVISAPDGTIVKRVFPRRLAPRDEPRPWRLRSLWFMQLVEFAVRRLLRQDVIYHFDLTPEQLRHPSLSVRIENLGKPTIVVGNLCLRTTTLARNRPLGNTHPIEGYSERVSVAAGGSLQLFVHAPAGRFSLRVVRFGAREETVLRVPHIDGVAQDYLADAYENGARWQPSYTLAIDPAWKSGLYSACVCDPDGASFDITFIVTSTGQPAPGALAVLASTNTWQAYNDWGGASLYRRDPDDGLALNHAFIVNNLRPNPAACPRGTLGHLANAERHVLAWLENNDIAYELFADADLHERPALLERFPALLLNTHSEYWSASMYRALEVFMARGGNLIYLSGNGLYWKTAIGKDRMEVRADHSCHTLSDDAGGQWRNFARPEWRMLGTRFTRAGYRSHFRPYKVIAPQHWIFENTGVAAGDLIGAAGLNCGGASGWELDKLDPAFRPPGLVHLAKGTNPWRTGADMVYFTHPGGGGVFSVGSITFGGSLAVDPVLSRMLLNVATRFVIAPCGQAPELPRQHAWPAATPAVTRP